MDFIKMSEERFSVRKFDSRPVEREKLDALFASARLSPTASNKQPQRILVLQSGIDDEALEKLYSVTDWNFQAPVVLLICYDKNESRKWIGGGDKGEIDISIVATQLTYACMELGLGSCMVGAYDRKNVSAALSLPENLVPALQLHLGYPKEGCCPGPLHGKRFPVEKTVFWSHF